MPSSCRYFSTCLYQFVKLMVNYIGGEPRMYRVLSGTELHLRGPPCCCCCVCLPTVSFSKWVMHLSVHVLTCTPVPCSEKELSWSEDKIQLNSLFSSYMCSIINCWRWVSFVCIGWFPCSQILSHVHSHYCPPNRSFPPSHFPHRCCPLDQRVLRPWWGNKPVRIAVFIVYGNSLLAMHKLSESV